MKVLIESVLNYLTVSIKNKLDSMLIIISTPYD